VFIYFHDGSKISASVAVVRSREDSYNVFIMPFEITLFINSKDFANILKKNQNFVKFLEF